MKIRPSGSPSRAGIVGDGYLSSASGGRRATRVTDTLLEPHRNVWRVERAQRAAPLIDAAAYFGALRQALREARHSISIVGWDIDSRMRLLDADCQARDDLPETFAAFLVALARRRPALRIRLLLWDFSVLFSLERELVPRLRLFWRTPPNIEMCLDDDLPLGASQHQKIVVIDDRVAFCGGIDLTRRRWDTPQHRVVDDRRTDPSGRSYRPFHDVQMAVEGDAARALGDVFRERWRRATDEKLEPVPHDLYAAGEAIWPDSLPPLWRDARIGVSRTNPAHDGYPPVREAEALWLDMIARAERLIYIENQFATSLPVARKLAQRLKECPSLEALIVLPKTYTEWFAKAAMLDGRRRFAQVLRQAGVDDRVRLVYPQVTDEGIGVAIMMHAKVTIVDDRWLRIGSANLCNRSMGFDSECDLVLEATTRDERAAVTRTCAQLLGEHIGMEPAACATAIEQTGSLFSVVDAAPRTRRRLVSISDPKDDLALPLGPLADPPEPLYDLGGEMEDKDGRSWRPLVLKITIALAAIVLVMLAWRFVPAADPEFIANALETIAEQPWAPFVVVCAFVVGGLVAFPVTVLILATVAVFGNWAGIFLAATGAMLSAIVTYSVGRQVGKSSLRRLVGPRINRIRRAMVNGGLLAVIGIRLVPLAPFTFINLVAGAMRVRFIDFCAGTLIGLMPGLLAMTVLAQQISQFVQNPSLKSAALFAALIVVWGLFLLAAHLLLRHRRGKKR